MTGRLQAGMSILGAGGAGRRSVAGLSGPCCGVRRPSFTSIIASTTRAPPHAATTAPVVIFRKTARAKPPANCTTPIAAMIAVTTRIPRPITFPHPRERMLRRLAGSRRQTVRGLAFNPSMSENSRLLRRRPAQAHQAARARASWVRCGTPARRKRTRARMRAAPPAATVTLKAAPWPELSASRPATPEPSA